MCPPEGLENTPFKNVGDFPLFFPKSVLGNLDPHLGTSTRTKEPLCTIIVNS
jgi:hypothetical protein